MPIPKKVIQFLDKSKVKYEPIKHKTVYTAYDKAATLRVPQKMVGKTLVMRIDKDTALVLIPANKNLDKQKLRKITKAKKVDFIKEVWIKKNLKGVKVGAIPPFGNLWKLPTFVDRILLKAPKIFVNAGDYNSSIKISPATFKKLMPNLVINIFTKSKPRYS